MPVASRPLVSVIICTRNPRPDLFQWTLDSLALQTLPCDDFETIVVDNGSKPPLQETPRVRMVREARPGLTAGRASGINQAKADLLVFADDDNYLLPDYLAQALRIAEECPWLGCFGGIVRAVFEAPAPLWQLPLLGYLGVRDFGPHAITSKKRSWGEWEPIGAGMVARRDVAEQYSIWVQSIRATRRLGRTGGGFMSGDDSLLAQAAYRLGYACAYQPSLQLAHWMKSHRLSEPILRRTILGHGRSHVVLEKLKGRQVPRLGVRALYDRYRERVEQHQQIGALEWFWELGVFLETHRSILL